jgi:hypothetical protein
MPTGAGDDGEAVTTALALCIAELIAAFQAGEAPHDWQRELARRFGALPLYGDMGGALLLRPDGEVLVVEWEAEANARPADRGGRLLCLAVAADTFPELRPLLPPRPAAAVSCPACNALGRLRLTGINHPLWCGECSGLGWLDAVCG